LRKEASKKARVSRPGRIHLRIVELMKAHPEGVSGGQIRKELGFPPEEQTHLDKRKRELRKWFVVRTSRSRSDEGKSITLYHLDGNLGEDEIVAGGSISKRVRAQVLHAAHGRCQMCGRTIEQHGITLVIDHKKPINWGGTDAPENLWAICEDCNGGKKAYFSSVKADATLMKRINAEASVHVRLGETLKAFGVGKPVPAYLLEIVADQEDWRKRIRDLRYSVIGWKIKAKRYRQKGKTYADYVLQSWKPWPKDPSGTIRRFEESRRQANRRTRSLSTEEGAK
jgi:5-methylcytosine-specific restriction endonuclease McrA